MTIFLIILLIIYLQTSQALILHWDTVFYSSLYFSCIRRIRGIISLHLPFKLQRERVIRGVTSMLNSFIHLYKFYSINATIANYDNITNAGNYKLMLYYDDEKMWKSVVHDQHTCYDKIYNARPSNGGEFKNIYSFSTRINDKGQYFLQQCITTSKVRYFYFVISNCKSINCKSNGCQGPINLIDIEMKFVNGNGRTKNLPADEVPIYNYSIAMFVIYIVLTLYTFFICVKLQKINKLHTIFGFLVLSIICQTLANLLKFLYYQNYIDKNSPTVDFEIGSKLLQYLSDIMLIDHLILIIKGWRIVRRKIGGNGRVKIMVYSVCYYCVSIFSYLYYKIIPSDVEATIAQYTHPISIIYLVVRIFTLFWYIYSYYTTRKNYDTKRRFLLKMLLCGGIYIISPVIVYIIVLFVDKWAQKFVQDLIQGMFALLMHLILVFLFTPGMCWSEKFPYFSTEIMSVEGKFVYKEELKELLLETVRLRAKYDFQINCFLKEINDGFELLSMIGKDLHLELNNDQLTDGTVRYVRSNGNEFKSQELKVKNKRPIANRNRNSNNNNTNNYNKR